MFQLSTDYGCERPVNTYIPRVVDVDGRLVVVLALGGLGLVGIVFYGPDYPGAEVSASGRHLCESTPFILDQTSLSSFGGVTRAHADGRFSGVLGLEGLKLSESFSTTLITPITKFQPLSIVCGRILRFRRPEVGEATAAKLSMPISPVYLNFSQMSVFFVTHIDP